MEVQIRNHEPGDGCKGEKNGRNEEGKVVTEFGDQSQCGTEGGPSAGNLVENVDHGIHAPELLNVSTNDISRNDTANELDHTICDTGHTEDGYYPVGFVSSVVGEILGVLGQASGLKVSTAAGVNNEKDGGEDAKNEDGSRKNDLGRESPDERGNEN